MQKNSLRAIASLALIVVVAVLLALAGSHDGAVWRGLPVFALCVAIAFIVQWVAFVPAFTLQTERFYDLTGSLTYLAIVVFALVTTQNFDMRSLLLAAMVAIWAIRLGSFLFVRVLQDRRDSRFDKIKTNPVRFFTAWTLQGLWISFTAAAALAALTSTQVVAFGWLGIVGAALWLAGFTIEALADHQKRVFKAQQKNSSDTTAPFITSGLWAYSRHPNYFGEILLWCGVALVALPALAGWQYVALLSPVFVYFLLTRVSGVPLLERDADARWGDNSEYQQYKSSTPVLVPCWRQARVD